MSYTGGRTASDFRLYVYNLSWNKWIVFNQPPNAGDVSHTECSNQDGTRPIGPMDFADGARQIRGNIYDLRWHNTALSTTEVEDTIKGVVATSCQARWNMEDYLTGGTAIDSVGAFNGTYVDAGSNSRSNVRELGYSNTREDISDEGVDLYKPAYGHVHRILGSRGFQSTNDFDPSNSEGYTIFKEFMTTGNNLPDFLYLFVAGVVGAGIAIILRDSPKQIQISSTGNVLRPDIPNDFNRPHIIAVVFAPPDSTRYGSSAFGLIVLYLNGIEIGRFTMTSTVINLSSLTNPTAFLYQDLSSANRYSGFGGLFAFYQGEASPRTIANCSITGRHRLPTFREIEQDSMIAFSELDFQAVNAFPIVVPDVSGNGNSFDGSGYSNLPDYQAGITDISNEFVNRTT